MTTYSSNMNGAVYQASCAPLVNPRVVLKASSPIIGNTSYEIGSWGLQMNCFSVKGSTCSFQQYVPEDVFNYTFIAFGFFKSNDYPFGWPALTVGPVNLPFPSGWTFDLRLATDPVTNHVTGGRLITLNDKGVVWKDFSWLNSALLSSLPGFDPSWFAPITAYTVELLTDNGRTDNFHSGSGTLQYIPSAGQSYSVWTPKASILHPGKTDYGPPSCAVLATQHTAEQAPNMLYSDFAPQLDGSLMQNFGLTLPGGLPRTLSVAVSVKKT